MNRKRKPQWRKLAAMVVCLAMILGMGMIAGSIQTVEPEDPITHTDHEIPQEAGPETQPAQAHGEGETGTEPETEPTEPSSEPTEPPTEPTEPRQTEPEGASQPTDPTQSTQPGQEDDPGPNGPTEGADDPTAPTVPGGEGDGEVTDDEMHIVTDLSNRVITFDELTDDRLGFYAYIANSEPDMYLRVKLRNSQTSANGTYLTAVGRDYEAALARQENNYITIYLKQGDKTLSDVTYVLRYVAQSANADDPAVGEHPPTVTTNLDDFEGNMTNRNFTFLVSARTYDEQVIYSGNIIVTMDGVTLTDPTGTNVFEYELTFPDPTDGDYGEHKITVLAWDGKGNSTYREYTVTYEFKDTGSVVGTAYIYVDATTVGLDPWTLGGGYSYEIKQNEPASYAVMAALEAMGYGVDYARTLDDGFYIRRLSRGGMCDYAGVPDDLWQKILDDGLSLTGQRYTDSLGEQDYTEGSGWMYSINGTLYAGKGLSGYYLSDGDTIYLRYTLAYGKDIGGYGGGYGTLSTYCGMWLYGGYTDLHKWGEITVLREPTCTEAGEEARACAVCGGKEDKAEIPALGHDYQETGRQEPTAEADGYIEYRCSRCGEVKQELLPKPTEPGTEATEPGTEPTEPDTEPTQPGTEATDPGTNEPEPGTFPPSDEDETEEETEDQEEAQ